MKLPRRLTLRPVFTRDCPLKGCLFRYTSSADEDCDTPSATVFRVIGTTFANQLAMELAYENNAVSGDRFEIAASVLLLPPNRRLTAMNAAITVRNVSGRHVTPFWGGHRDLAEQWELFGISSMYVADHLSGGIPAWYDLLDPDHDYVGITNDSDFLNDGFSQNGGLYVSTHDAKNIVAGGQRQYSGQVGAGRFCGRVAGWGCPSDSTEP